MSMVRKPALPPETYAVVPSTATLRTDAPEMPSVVTRVGAAGSETSYTLSPDVEAPT